MVVEATYVRNRPHPTGTGQLSSLPCQQLGAVPAPTEPGHSLLTRLEEAVQRAAVKTSLQSRQGSNKAPSRHSLPVLCKSSHGHRARPGLRHHLSDHVHTMTNDHSDAYGDRTKSPRRYFKPELGSPTAPRCPSGRPELVPLTACPTRPATRRVRHWSPRLPLRPAPTFLPTVGCQSLGVPTKRL